MLSHFLLSTREDPERPHVTCGFHSSRCSKIPNCSRSSASVCQTYDDNVAGKLTLVRNRGRQMHITYSSPHHLVQRQAVGSGRTWWRPFQAARDEALSSNRRASPWRESWKGTEPTPRKFVAVVISSLPLRNRFDTIPDPRFWPGQQEGDSMGFSSRELEARCGDVLMHMILFPVNWFSELEIGMHLEVGGGRSCMNLCWRYMEGWWSRF